MSSITSQVDACNPARVYGRDIKTWTVDGVQGRTFADVIAHASLRQATSTEAMALAVTDFVDLRQRKVSDLGAALAVICEAIGSMDPKESNPDKRYSTISISQLDEANAVLAKYGIDKMKIDSKKGVNYTVASKHQTLVRTELDNETNDLRQTMNLLDGIVKKRENSFSVAAKVMEKANTTAIQSVRALGS